MGKSGSEATGKEDGAKEEGGRGKLCRQGTVSPANAPCQAGTRFPQPSLTPGLPRAAFTLTGILS